MSKRAFLMWRWAVVFFANVPNLGMVAWLFFWVTRTSPAPSPGALRWNLALFAGFAAIHSAMATHAWKRLFCSVFPEAFERATYVVVSGVTLLVLLASWRPMPALLWRIEGVAGHVLDVTFWGALAAAWWVSRHFDEAAFVGTRQLAAYYKGTPIVNAPFVVKGPFRFTRHPMYLAMLVLLWSASTMTTGRLLFAILASAYFLIGLRFEERRLARDVGEPYELYRRNVPVLWPRLTPWTQPSPQPSSAEGARV